MYSNQFNVSILVNNSVCPESEAGIVTIPTNTEYQIKLTNKNGRRALAKVLIDKENKTQDGLIVNAYSDVVLDCSTDKRLRFKFVSSQSAEAYAEGKHHNTNDENGVVTVIWALEHCKPRFTDYRKNDGWTHPIEKHWANGPSLCGAPRSLSFSETGEGCTVNGGRSNQKFVEVPFEAETTATIIKLILRVGELKAEHSYCPFCGKSSKNHWKYCPKCGNQL